MTATFRTGDVSKEACGFRMRLVREAIGRREGRYLSRTRFGPRIGVEEKNLGAIETGVSYPRPTYVQRIFEQWNIDWNFIYHGKYDTMQLALVDELIEAADALRNREADRDGSD